MRTKSLNLYSHLVTQLNKVLFCGGFRYTSYKRLRMDISNLQVQIVQTMIGQYTPAKRGQLFERFIQLGKHVKIAINISITGTFG